MVLMEKALSWTRHELDSRGLRRPGECKIVIIGVGGCGNNTIDRLMKTGLGGADCIAINTDVQHLNMIHADKKILIGERITRGLGAGNMPSVGKDAMHESADAIERLITGTDIVFVTAGMGGGTGTGAAPVVAEIAREKGAIVVGVVTMPFRHEKGRFDYAVEGLNKMRRATHTTVIIDNNKLMDLVPQLPINTAFTFADSILANMVKGIVETIALPSLINLDFADFRTIMTKGDVAIVGMGHSNSPDRAEEASRNAMEHMLLDVDYGGADGALIHVSGGSDMSLGEAVRAAEYVTEMMGDKAMVIWGSRVDPDLNDMLRVTLVLTGIRSPQLISGYEIPDIQLYNLEPFAGPETPIGLELGLYDIESHRYR
ncbi:MAG: cell division protein FtsZ [Candidatus Bathyarchaeota archaeon]|jgi:cell division protein FtsZ|nr:cell division protein FtsZ [Candidatus Bathyarchaeota archaeon]